MADGIEQFLRIGKRAQELAFIESAWRKSPRGSGWPN
jgi:hypothetical protein